MLETALSSFEPGFVLMREQPDEQIRRELLGHGQMSLSL